MYIQSKFFLLRILFVLSTCISPCIMCTHAFVRIIQGIIIHTVCNHYNMYNVHPYSSLKYLGKKCALYMAKNTVLPAFSFMFNIFILHLFNAISLSSINKF